MTNPQFALQLGESIEQLTKLAMEGGITGFAIVFTHEKSHGFPLIQANWKDPNAFFGVMYGLRLAEHRIIAANQAPEAPTIVVPDLGRMQ